jgi:hypothetical protein
VQSRTPGVKLCSGAGCIARTSKRSPWVRAERPASSQSQTRLVMESLVMNTYSDTAEFTLIPLSVSPTGIRSLRFRRMCGR